MLGLDIITLVVPPWFGLVSTPLAAAALGLDRVILLLGELMERVFGGLAVRVVPCNGGGTPPTLPAVPPAAAEAATTEDGRMLLLDVATEELSTAVEAVVGEGCTATPMLLDMEAIIPPLLLLVPLLITTLPLLQWTPSVSPIMTHRKDSRVKM